MYTMIFRGLFVKDAQQKDTYSRSVEELMPNCTTSCEMQVRTPGFLSMSGATFEQAVCVLL